MVEIEQNQMPINIKEMTTKQLESLSEKLREELVNTIKENGGHLSSNLGIVETTIALFKVFDFSCDKIVFDVGHQCYAYKILTDRANKFKTIRLEGGISGFPDREESEFDAFSVGHAGTSLSVGLGYCKARDLQQQDYCVINIVGDGAFSNGLNLEALSVSNKKPTNYIVILNDNGMSISKNGNGFYNLISKSTTKNVYVNSKKAIKKIFRNSFITRGLIRFRDFVKRILNKNSYIEGFGFKYVGIVDGNNIKKMVKILGRAKTYSKDKAVFLHIKTTKGKGFSKAETQADLYHGVGKNFDTTSGEFSEKLGEALNKIIKENKKVVAITAAMKDGTGLSAVEKEHPNNFIDVGIAEEYAITLSGGMAAGGLKPVVAIYSTFMQRAYDQILHDVCLQNLPVVFCLDRAGFVGRDGKTHQGLFDLSFLSHIPNLTILSPGSAEELQGALEYALSLNKPVAIRYPKNGKVENYPQKYFNGKWEWIKQGKKTVILAVGPRMINLAKTCAENSKKDVGIVSCKSIKPLDESILLEIAKSKIITLEENYSIGGFGSLVSAFYSKNNLSTKVIVKGVEDCFVGHGSIEHQMKVNGFSVEEINELL